MRYRDSSIVAYYNRKDARIYCRLCISKDVDSSVVFSDECAYNMQCCCYGSHPDKYSKFFRFDNTKHDIVISESECKMCSYHNGNCLVKRGHECPFNIPKYLKDFSNQIDESRRE